MRGAPVPARLACPLLGVLVLVLVFLCAARPAHAASRSVSYSTWIIGSDTVTLRFVLPAAEAERLTGSAIPVLTVSKLGDYVLEHTGVVSSGHDCPAIDQGYDLGRVDPVRVGAGLYGFEIFFRCGEPMRSLVLENRAIFERVPSHVDFARVEVGRRFTDQLFTAGRQRVRIADPAATPQAAWSEYVGLGFLHVLRDAARLCFLIAALLAVRRPREGLAILAGLAAGYVLALAARGAGLIVSEQPMTEAFIGFLVALCAVAIVAPQLARPAIAMVGWPLVLLGLAIIAAGLRALRPALLLAGAAGLSAGFLAAIRVGVPRGMMALPAAVFAFLDGFVLPSLLAPLGLTASSRVRMSIGYDLGALLAEAGVLALAAGALRLARRFANGGFAEPRVFARAGSLDSVVAAQPAVRGPLIELLSAAAFAGLGTFWLVSRLPA
ncbi:MAG: hypothetical protein ACREUT_15090 [Steroidobacteraceae bacterium]